MRYLIIIIFLFNAMGNAQKLSPYLMSKQTDGLAKKAITEKQHLLIRGEGDYLKKLEA
ncbi:MAG: hypothetical protein GF313_01250, partial [Caldithrix sp.]|nr:hypothetical protein [Caldithrix sp.]